MQIKFLKLLAIVGLLLSVSPNCSATCRQLVNSLGHSIFHPVETNRAWLSRSSEGEETLYRTGRMNTPEGWYEIYQVSLRNPKNSDMEGLVDVARLPLRMRYDDSAIVNGKDVFPVFYVRAENEGSGNYQTDQASPKFPTAAT